MAFSLRDSIFIVVYNACIVSQCRQIVIKDEEKKKQQLKQNLKKKNGGKKMRNKFNQSEYKNKAAMAPYTKIT